MPGSVFIVFLLETSPGLRPPGGVLFSAGGIPTLGVFQLCLRFPCQLFLLPPHSALGGRKNGIRVCFPFSEPQGILHFFLSLRFARSLLMQILYYFLLPRGLRPREPSDKKRGVA